MSIIPHSLSNPELGRKFFNNRKFQNKSANRNINCGKPKAKLSTCSDKGTDSNQKSSKMCNIL